VRLAADFERLEYLRVLRHLGSERIEDPGSLVAPRFMPGAPAAEAEAAEAETEAATPPGEDPGNG